MVLEPSEVVELHRRTFLRLIKTGPRSSPLIDRYLRRLIADGDFAYPVGLHLPP